MTSDSALRRYFRTWGLSGHCADCREMCGWQLRHASLNRRRPAQQLQQLPMLAAMRRASSLVSSLAAARRATANSWLNQMLGRTGARAR